MSIALGDFSVPVAWLGLANVMFVLVLVPLIRSGLFPCLEKYKILLTNAGKMSIGMAASLKFTGLSMSKFDTCCQSCTWDGLHALDIQL